MSDYPAILYVEDDPGSRRVMELLVKYEMALTHYTIFEDSVDFLARVAALQPRPDLILLDIHLKPLDGFEMLNLLRKMDGFEKTPIVALTASVMNEEIEQLKTSGFHSVIAKPLDVDTFPDLLERILKGETLWRITEQ